VGGLKGKYLGFYTLKWDFNYFFQSFLSIFILISGVSSDCLLVVAGDLHLKEIGIWEC
jgi:hypothetical protein